MCTQASVSSGFQLFSCFAVLTVTAQYIALYLMKVGCYEFDEVTTWVGFASVESDNCVNLILNGLMYSEAIHFGELRLQYLSPHH